MNIQPLANRLTLKVPEAPTKVGSIWLPPEAQGTYTLCQAEIVARGPTVRDIRLQPGLRVIVQRFGGVPHDSDKSLWTVYEHAILAIVKEEM